MTAPGPDDVADPVFDAKAFLGSAGLSKTMVRYARDEVIFAQGDAGAHVLYVQSGGVRLSVVSKRGKEAVIALLGPGAFFGEGCLAGQAVRMSSATAIMPSAILRVEKPRMIRVLQRQHELSDRFITHLVTRNIRIEEDLIAQLFDSSEKRLARTLLLLARYGEQDTPLRAVPRVSQDILAEIAGTTRSRVNAVLHKFKRLGFIEYDGKQHPMTINESLLSVVLHD